MHVCTSYCVSTVLNTGATLACMIMKISMKYNYMYKTSRGCTYKVHRSYQAQWNVAESCSGILQFAVIIVSPLGYAIVAQDQMYTC